MIHFVNRNFSNYTRHSSLKKYTGINERHSIIVASRPVHCDTFNLCQLTWNHNKRKLIEKLISLEILWEKWKSDWNYEDICVKFFIVNFFLSSSRWALMTNFLFQTYLKITDMTEINIFFDIYFWWSNFFLSKLTRACA